MNDNYKFVGFMTVLIILLMLNSSGLKKLKPNIQSFVQQILRNKKYSGFDWKVDALTGDNQTTIDQINNQIEHFLECKQENPNIRTKISDSKINKQIKKVTFIGWINSLYQDKKIIVYLFFPDAYPNRHPLVIFESVTINGKQEPFQHINVFSKGMLAQRINKSGFSQQVHLFGILKVIQNTIYDPDEGSPANGTLASLYRKDKTQYYNVIRRQIQCLEWADVEN